MKYFRQFECRETAISFHYAIDLLPDRVMTVSSNSIRWGG